MAIGTPFDYTDEPLIPFTPPSPEVIALLDAMMKAAHPLFVVEPLPTYSLEDPHFAFGKDEDQYYDPRPIDCGRCGGVHSEGEMCRTRRQPEAVFDYDAIANRVAQLNGKAPSGTYYREVPCWHPPGDKREIRRTELVQSGHDMDWCTDRCTRCGFGRAEFEDGIAPKVCPGKIDGEACIQCGQNAVVSSDRLGYALFKTWCLKCGHGVWTERGKPVKCRG